MGSSGCGKTSFISRCVFDEFDKNYAPTLTEDCYQKSMVVGVQEHIIDILDVNGSPAGQANYERVTNFSKQN